MKTYQPLTLHDYVNNRGITYQNEYEKGQLTIGGASLPAELVMNVKDSLVEGIPFQFIYQDQGDNIELEVSLFNFRQLKQKRSMSLAVHLMVISTKR